MAGNAPNPAVAPSADAYLVAEIFEAYDRSVCDLTVTVNLVGYVSYVNFRGGIASLRLCDVTGGIEVVSSRAALACAWPEFRRIRCGARISVFGVVAPSSAGSLFIRLDNFAVLSSPADYL